MRFCEPRNFESLNPGLVNSEVPAGLVAPVSMLVAEKGKISHDIGPFARRKKLLDSCLVATSYILVTPIQVLCL